MLIGNWILSLTHLYNYYEYDPYFHISQKAHGMQNVFSYKCILEFYHRFKYYM